MQVALGLPIPLLVEVEDGVTDRVIKADLVDALSGEVFEEDVILAYIPLSPGRYLNNSLLMPEISYLLVSYTVYESDGVTVVARASENLELATTGGTSGTSLGLSTETIVGTLEDETLAGFVNVGG